VFYLDLIAVFNDNVSKRRNTHLTVATDCVVSICCRSRNKDPKVEHSTGKRRTSKCGSVMCSAEVIEIPRGNVNNGVTRDTMPCHWHMEIFIKAPNGWLQNIMLNRHIKDFMNHISVLLITSATTCLFMCVSMVGINVILLHFRPFICIPQHMSHGMDILEILYWTFT
jgi:hypothetical protein